MDVILILAVILVVLALVWSAMVIHTAYELVRADEWTDRD